MTDYTTTSHAPLPREPYEGMTKLPEFTLTSTPNKIPVSKSSLKVCFEKNPS